MIAATTSIAAIAWNGFREARRNRITVIVVAFAAVLLLSTTLVTEVTVKTIERVVIDFGLGTMSLMLAALSVFLSCGVLSREIERKTIYLVVGKPVRRSWFLIGRLLGTFMTLAALMLLMTGLYLLQAWMHHVQWSGAQGAALIGLFFELAVLSATGVFFSTFSGQVVSIVATTGIYFSGHLSWAIYKLADKTPNEALRLLGKCVYYLLPSLDRVDFRPMATYALPVEPMAVFWACLYAAAYVSALAALSCVIFESRDFK